MAIVETVIENKGAVCGSPGEAPRPLRDDEQELVAEEADDVVGGLPRASPTTEFDAARSQLVSRFRQPANTC